MRRTASSLTFGTVTGITMTAWMPSFAAASATPWAWLPADAAITPQARWGGSRRLILL